MTMLNDFQISQLCTRSTWRGVKREPMITPFIDHKVKGHDNEQGDFVPCLSYGLDSFGYDIRMNPEGIRYLQVGRLIDPFDVDEKAYPFLHPSRIGENAYGKYVDLYLGEAILGKSIEYFDIPNNVKVIVLGKSTYARGAVLNLTTPAEAGWKGYLTIEVVNCSQAVARVYLGNNGIVSLTFLQGTTPMRTYGDGKYQNQGNEVVLPRAVNYNIAEEQYHDIDAGYNLIGEPFPSDPLDYEF